LFEKAQLGGIPTCEDELFGGAGNRSEVENKLRETSLNRVWKVLRQLRSCNTTVRQHGIPYWYHKVHVWLLPAPGLGPSLLIKLLRLPKTLFLTFICITRVLWTNLILDIFIARKESTNEYIPSLIENDFLLNASSINTSVLMMNRYLYREGLVKVSASTCCTEIVALYSYTQRL
jgi:hypothetical protein